MRTTMVATKTAASKPQKRKDDRRPTVDDEGAPAVVDCGPSSIVPGMSLRSFLVRRTL